MVCVYFCGAFGVLFVIIGQFDVGKLAVDRFFPFFLIVKYVSDKVFSLKGSRS